MLTFFPVADATIKASSPTTNFGATTGVKADNSPVEHFLIKFVVSGIGANPVKSAKLRLYNFNGSNRGGDFRRVADNSWSESTVTWKNAPAADTAILASLGAVSTNRWYEVDLSSYITRDGTYSLRVTSPSSDGAEYRSKEAGATTSPRLVVTVSSTPPLGANAGPNQAGPEGATFSFTGSASGGTSPYTFAWAFGDDTGGSGPGVTHAYGDNGTFTVTLTVTDAAAKTASSTATATVSNVAPTANAGGPYAGVMGSPIAFSGSATDPSAADTAAGFTFLWDFGDGATGTGSAPSHAYAAAGTYTVKLTATDKDGAPGSATTTATVSGPLSANAGANYAGPEGAPLSFTGSASGGTGPYTFAWAFGDGTTGSGPSVTHAYGDNATFTVTLTVTDAAAKTASSTATATVSNVAPTAKPGGPYAGVMGSPIAFSGSATDPSAADTAAGFTFLWDFGDGATDAGSAPSHAYAAAGTYTVGLTVTDKDGGVGTATTAATVSGPLTANAGPDQLSTEGLMLPITGSATGGTSPYSFAWAFGDGTTGVGSSVTHAYGDNGTFTVTLTVTDAAGRTASSTATATVSNVAPTAKPGGPYAGVPGSPIAFSGSATDPSPADTAAGFTFLWDFGDGTPMVTATGTGSAPSHAYAAAGTYTVGLTVTDKDGAPGSATTTATVASRAFRATFYYPSYPEAWSQQGSHYTPIFGSYSSTNQGVIDSHLRSLQYGKFDAGIYSWWGQTSNENARFPQMLSRTAAVYPALRWALYYECEGSAASTCPGGPDPSESQVATDLAYIKSTHGSNANYLQVDGKPVVFVRNANDTDCSVVTKYKNANTTVGVYLVLKVFAGYRNCVDQPDSWHQYDPSTDRDVQAGYSFMISPGLVRDLTRWNQDVRDMTASPEMWHLVVSFNGWGEGTQVEHSNELETNYLDALATDGQPQPTPQVLAGAGDIASSGNDDAATANLLDAINPTTVFTAGDNAYGTGTFSQFSLYYDPTWGRHKATTRPAPGNHDYDTTGAAGYFDYFNGVGTFTGPAGDRDKGYYAYNLGSWRIYALNSEIDASATSAQVTWLKNDLAANSDVRCVLAYWHKPLKSAGTHGDNSYVKPLFQALYDGNAHVVVSGHDHNYQRWKLIDPNGNADQVRGIRQFVVGTGGASHYTTSNRPANMEVYDGQTFGVLTLTLHAVKYEFQFEPIAGQAFSDSGWGACH